MAQRLKCGDKTNQMMVDMASGELNSWQKRRLMRHIAACAACRAEWDEIQRLWQGLGSLSTSPVPQHAGRTALNRVNAAMDRPTFTKGDTKKMKKRVILLALTAIFLIAAGAVAQKYIGSREGGTLENGDHTYKVLGDFRGMVKFYDQNNQPQGTIGTGTAFGGGDPVHGAVDITADGQNFHFEGPGRYELRDTKGVLHGYAVLVPTTDKEMAAMHAVYLQTPAKFEDLVPWVQKQATKNGAVSGGGGGSFYIYHFDTAQGYFFLMQGIGRVTVMDPSGNQIGSGGQFGLVTKGTLAQMRAMAPPGIDITDQELKSPRVAIIVNGKETDSQGYGVYPIKDANGHLIVTIDAEPPITQPLVQK